jgi:hypothetical protein
LTKFGAPLDGVKAEDFTEPEAFFRVNLDLLPGELSFFFDRAMCTHRGSFVVTQGREKS